MHAFCRDSYPFVEMRFKINDYIPESLGKNKGVLPSRPLSNGAAVVMVHLQPGMASGWPGFHPPVAAGHVR